MKLKLFGYTMDRNIVILFGILFLIMVVSALNWSSNREGLVGSISPKVDEASRVARAAARDAAEAAARAAAEEAARVAAAKAKEEAKEKAKNIFKKRR